MNIAEATPPKAKRTRSSSGPVRAWTEADDKTMRAYFPTMHNLTLSIKLGRTESSIVQRASRLRLPKLPAGTARQTPAPLPPAAPVAKAPSMATKPAPTAPPAKAPKRSAAKKGATAPVAKALSAPARPAPAVAKMPAAAPLQIDLTGTGINPHLHERLMKAVNTLKGQGHGRGREIDAHDRQQALNLLKAHADKLHLVPGADKYAKTADEHVVNLDF